MPNVLESQQQFESMWFHEDPARASLSGTRAADRGWIVQYSAKWCGPCKRIDSAALDAAAKARGLTVWKCDIDENEYTPGYCGVRAVPTFHFCVPRKIVSKKEGGSTEEVVAWINGL